jgi:hypothetical protein
MQLTGCRTSARPRQPDARISRAAAQPDTGFRPTPTPRVHPMPARQRPTRPAQPHPTGPCGSALISSACCGCGRSPGLWARSSGNFTTPRNSTPGQPRSRSPSRTCRAAGHKIATDFVGASFCNSGHAGAQLDGRRAKCLRVLLHSVDHRSENRVRVRLSEIQ